MDCIKRNRLLWYWISKNEVIGHKTIVMLLYAFHSIEGVYQAKQEELLKLGLKEEVISYLNKKYSMEELENEYNYTKKRGIHFICIEDKEYPEKLKKLYDAPWFLYYRGELPKDDLPSIAVIGARNCSAYGSDAAYYFSKELSLFGIQIISGLARGVDGMAHSGALSCGGKTYGVIGNGLDLCYPRENYGLYQEVNLHGGILSEYPIGSKALPYHFPLRNRIIAALSDGILVVEAREKSGTLITVDSGLEQGKDIFALPGKLTDVLSKGCNLLIQSGAKLVLSPEDILVELRNQYSSLLGVTTREINSTKEGLTEVEQLVYSFLSHEAIHVEELLMKTNLNQGQLLEVLFELESKQYVRMISGQQYVRTM
ncbi:DNA-processing protein DprA [Lachnoclostridium phytofermentans]|uniref:DNA protecting protein DprA n=1 Tax=Lachnoclostridium phytofermentans (strain ATCC 700394 / DSM 18823 / ISDg) TaxID=357809 RepID=A9KNG7_LACP7|nr:DNA-processing protein DprA [Lachnoclostridium phytofermentans]ABX43084.1 DNA protecting protein DprA [Lachnoclostridium phytofermentans ISDg]